MIFGKIFRTTGPDLPFEDVKAGPVAVTEKRETTIDVINMRTKKKLKKLRITEKDFLLANRRAARMEEIEAHGRPVSFRGTMYKSKKVYDRKLIKKTTEYEKGNL